MEPRFVTKAVNTNYQFKSSLYYSALAERSRSRKGAFIKMVSLVRHCAMVGVVGAMFGYIFYVGL